MERLRQDLSNLIQEGLNTIAEVKDLNDQNFNVQFYNDYYKLFEECKERNSSKKISLEPLKQRIRKLVSDAFIRITQGKTDASFKTQFFEDYHRIFDEMKPKNRKDGLISRFKFGW